MDSSSVCEGIIRENLAHTHLEERAEVIRRDAAAALQMLAVRNERFDLIFMDPPYAAGLVVPTLAAIVKGGLLAEDGQIVVERPSTGEMPLVPGLARKREKVYRVTTMTFLTLEGKRIC